MIFVTVGLHTQGFERLIRKVDEIALRIDEKVTMQIGHSKYIPRNAEYFRFKSVKEIEEMLRRARIVVCHDGAGSMLSALEHCKRTIVVPRRKKYGECAYDSQAELAVELEKHHVISLVYEIEELEQLLKSPDSLMNASKSTRPSLVSALKGYIDRQDI